MNKIFLVIIGIVLFLGIFAIIGVSSTGLFILNKSKIVTYLNNSEVSYKDLRDFKIPSFVPKVSLNYNLSHKLLLANYFDLDKPKWNDVFIDENNSMFPIKIIWEKNILIKDYGIDSVIHVYTNKGKLISSLRFKRNDSSIEDIHKVNLTCNTKIPHLNLMVGTFSSGIFLCDLNNNLVSSKFGVPFLENYDENQQYPNPKNIEYIPLVMDLGNCNSNYCEINYKIKDSLNIIQNDCIISKDCDFYFKSYDYYGGYFNVSKLEPYFFENEILTHNIFISKINSVEIPGKLFSKYIVDLELYLEQGNKCDLDSDCLIYDCINLTYLQNKYCGGCVGLFNDANNSKFCCNGLTLGQINEKDVCLKLSGSICNSNIECVSNICNLGYCK